MSTMTPTNNPNAALVDANILISICSKERLTFPLADSAFKTFAQNGWDFFAPNVIVAEGMFALCNKLQAGVLTQTGYEQAIDFFAGFMQFIQTPEDESSLMKRAVEIRGAYGCSRSSDGLYIALAEELSQSRVTEILTFDQGIKNQIANHAPTVALNLLII
jgi:predicted nucleic acid-binding protein